MRIIFFTDKCSNGAELLKQIRINNILLEAIFIQRTGFYKNLIKKLVTSVKQDGLGNTLIIIFKRLTMILGLSTKADWQTNEFYYNYANRVYDVDSFNGEKCEQLLADLKPDLIILGGTGIIRKNIINIPRIGILNAHPGLLPKYRGVDVIPWAIYFGDDVGVTVHFIDEGVDTGIIVAQSVINIADSDTIDNLREKAKIVAGELMAQVVLKIIRNQHLQGIPQSNTDGKQYYKMPTKLLRETEIKLRRMRLK